MDIIGTDIPGVFAIRPKVFKDPRGSFAETYSKMRFDAAAGGPVEFVQDNHSVSHPAHVLRGLHFQRHPSAQGKLVRCVRGRIWDVAADVRRGSPTFGRHVAMELSAENGLQLWVPAGFAHGFLTLEPDTEVVYKVTAYYDPVADGGILWNDPGLAIPWPLPAGAAPVLSDKDARLPLLDPSQPPFEYSA